MNAKGKRHAIIQLPKAGNSASFIIKHLNYQRQTVYDAIKRFKELGTSNDRARTGRPVTATTTYIKRRIHQPVQRNPERSMRQMEKTSELKIGKEKSVRNVVTKDLMLRPYKLSRGHFISNNSKIKRLKLARKLLRNFANGRHRNILFTDEKLFTVLKIHNRQNQQVLLPNGTHRPIVLRHYFPKSIMV
ncbi:uncharacterized protein LOC136089838 [Hydra vulgaris]|uniref:Uncharacterized protein LOC136089838 n=1 Tax=Hydra vulgaris TaxID=6087 RepID=A0ABM4DC87_HYDVU